MSSVFASLTHVLKSRDPDIENRRARRDLVDMISHVTARGRTQGVRIINISALGLMCRSDGEILMGERVTVWLPMLKDCPAEVRWVEHGRVGLEFLEPIKPRIYDALLTLIPPRTVDW